MIRDNWQTIRALKPEIRTYLGGYFVFMFSYAGMRAVLMNLYMLRLGYGLETIGVLNGLTYGTFALFALPAGWLAKRFAVRPMIVAGAILLCAANVLMIANELFTREIGRYVLFASGLVMGVGGALFIVCSLPFLMTCAPEHTNSVFSYRFLASLLGGFCGAVVAGVLPGAFGQLTAMSAEGPTVYRHSLILAAAISAVPIATSLRMGRTRAEERVGAERDPPATAPGAIALETGTSESVAQKAPAVAGVSGSAASRLVWIIGIMVLVTFLSTMGHTASHSFYNLFLERVFSVPVATIGIVMGLSQIIKLPGALMAPSLTKRYGPYRLMLASGFVRSSAVLAIALAPHWIWTAAALLVSAVVESAAAGAGDLFSQSIVEPGDRPIMAGAFTTAFGIGGATLLFAGGFIAASVGFSRLYMIAAVTSFASVVLLWLAFRSKVKDLLPDYHADAATPATAKL